MVDPLILDEGLAPSCHSEDSSQFGAHIHLQMEEAVTVPTGLDTFQPGPLDVIQGLEGGDWERKIHLNIGLSQEEALHLSRFYEFLWENDLRFPKYLLKRATRYLSTARNDYAKACEMMKATYAWRSQMLAAPLVDTDVFYLLKSGFLYWCGRDLSFRPILVFRASRMPKSAGIPELVRCAVFCMEYLCRYMLVPSKVETFNLIVDLQGFGFLSIPLYTIHQVESIFSRHYPGRTYKTLVVNAPYLVQSAMPILRKFLTTRQNLKLHVLNVARSVAQHLPASQLEGQYGGVRPAIREFYPWPMLDTPSGRVMELAEIDGDLLSHPFPTFEQVFKDRPRPALKTEIVSPILRSSFSPASYRVLSFFCLRPRRF